MVSFRHRITYTLAVHRVVFYNRYSRRSRHILQEPTSSRIGSCAISIANSCITMGWRTSISVCKRSNPESEKVWFPGGVSIIWLCSFLVCVWMCSILASEPTRMKAQLVIVGVVSYGWSFLSLDEGRGVGRRLGSMRGATVSRAR